MSIFDINELNSQQIEAVESIFGYVLVLAGAGSGKTKTITYRIANMISKGIDSESILALTFTRKAAEEMKERVAKLIGKKVVKNICTFHSFCLKQLKKHYDVFGYKNNFSIYDSDDQKKILYSIARSRKLSNDDIDVIKLSEKISSLKENGISPDKYFENSSFRIEKHFLQIYIEYLNILRNNNAIDFSDILFYFKDILKNEEIKNDFQNRFKFFMVDEYQDTNQIQWDIVDCLSKSSGNLFVVGDENQSIYGFRGADVEKILNFSKNYPNSKIIKLEENFRSTKQILQVANHVVKNIANATDKYLWSNVDGSKPSVNIFDNENMESVWVVEEIKKLISLGYKYSDISILYRNNIQSKDFEKVLIENQIPYNINETLNVYQKKDVKDLISYIKILLNPYDNLSILRIINVPSRGIGKAALNFLNTVSKSENYSIYEVIYFFKGEEKKHESIRNLRNFLIKIKEIHDNQGLLESVKYIVEETKYIESIKEEERVKDFISFLKMFEDTVKKYNIKTAEEYLEHIFLFIDNNDNDDKIELMTIHSSKGLEFEIVFLTGLEEELFPNTRSMFNSKSLEEEKRLFYVGITRAKKILKMSCCKNRSIYNSHLFNLNLISRKISRFLELIPENMLVYNYEKSDNNEESKKIIKTKSIKENKKGFVIGNVILHKNFGKGRISKIVGDRIFIDFEARGQKVFLTEVLSDFLIR